MNKILLVTNYNYPDYGGMLQSFALHYYLNQNGFQNDVLNIEGVQKIIVRRKKIYFLENITHFSIVTEKFGIIKKRIIKIFNRKVKDAQNIRLNKFVDFACKYFRVSPKLSSFYELTEFAKSYNAVIVGSDQLWLPSNVVADLYTLNFVPNNIKKICYATSFGISYIPQKYKSKYIKFLNRFNYLSARETSGRDIIKSLIGRDVQVVCDPTMLLTYEIWDNISGFERLINEEYIFCYFMGDNPSHRQFVKKLADKTGLKICALTHLDAYLSCDNNYADFTPFNIGPFEFVNLIKNAKIVFTDSFHASVFSIMFNKLFYTFKRFNNKAELSTNTRLLSLLAIFNLKDRYVEDVSKIDDIKTIDYSNTNEVLSQLRQSSREYLFKAIEG